MVLRRSAQQPELHSKKSPRILLRALPVAAPLVLAIAGVLVVPQLARSAGNAAELSAATQGAVLAGHNSPGGNAPGGGSEIESLSLQIDQLRSAHQRATVRAAKENAARLRAARLAAAHRAAQERAAAQASQPTQPTQQQAVVPSGGPQAIASAMLGGFGWGQDQMSCLVPLWDRESNWNPSAENPASGAYGIPQALPGSKMASAGADWATNPATQIRWGLGYIASVYGTPCGAWAHSQATGWY